jgi:ascorbate-specific PTS system EIIC-type component UlaA
MNVQVLGDDISYGADSYWGSAVKTVTNFIKSDIGKVVVGTGLAVIGAKLTPTQKAQLANAQVAAGIPLVPYNNSQPVEKPDVKKDNTSYFIVGGAVLIAGLFLFSTMKRR